jgi:NhaP-type Na+/H+ or K+/H+ antiporter
LLERHVTATGRASTFWDWAFVAALFTCMIGLLVGAVAGVIWLVERLRHAA